MTADQIEKELGWERGVDYPEWGHTDVYLNTISRGYCLPGETPKDAYWRVATTVANRLKKPEMADKFMKYIWKGWLNLASPVLSNTGTEMLYGRFATKTVGLISKCFRVIASSFITINFSLEKPFSVTVIGN